MKTTELKSIITGIIQEELKRILPAMIPQILTEILSNNTRVNIHENSKSEPTVDVKSVQPTPPKPFKKYTNNELLNTVLNETVGGHPKEGPRVGYSHNMSTSKDSTSFLNESIQEPIIPVNEEQSKVLNIINKDFRSLMNAVDKKRKSGNISSDLVSSE